MRILFLNPFHGGSHAAVAEGYARHSRHEVTIAPLSIAGGWRWRMRGAAVTLARRLAEICDGAPARARFDLLLTTDILDLAAFLGLSGDLAAGLPRAVYFHENQLTYPLPPGRGRDLSFAWTNYTTALAADALLFNSDFHRRSFLAALPDLPGRYHDHQELDLVAWIEAKSQVLYPGVELPSHDQAEQDRETESPPLILWNSRWEYDKQPQVFFDALAELELREVDFRLAVAGEPIDSNAPEFTAARERFAARIVSWGYVPDVSAYHELLARSDVVVSTAAQEFFGIALVEAMACGCVPVAPRRLSYPEIIPPEHHAACLYPDDAALAGTLQAALANLPALKARDFRSVAARYGWSRMAPRYDAALEAIGRWEGLREDFTLP